MATQIPAEKDANQSPTSDVVTHDPFAEFDTLIVGIPTYNEEIAIGSIVVESQQYADEVIVVDDGSSDNTVRIARNAGATVIEHEENKGKGGALQTLLGSVDDRDIDGLVLIDGDGQHIPEDIPEVARPVLEQECEISIGSRYIETKKTETPRHRRFGQRVLDLLTLGSSGANLTDTQSGFRALSPEAVSQLNLRTNGMGVESEMISDAQDSDLRITEIPIEVRYEDVDGQTYNPLRHGLSVAVFILQLIRDRHPLLFFGIPGVIALIIGGVVAFQTAWLYQTTGAFHQWRGLISGFTILIGVLAVFCGIVLSQIQNIILKMNE